MKKITLIFAALLIGAATLSAQNAFVGGHRAWTFALQGGPMYSVNENGFSYRENGYGGKLFSLQGSAAIGFEFTEALGLRLSVAYGDNRSAANTRQTAAHGFYPYNFRSVNGFLDGTLDLNGNYAVERAFRPRLYAGIGVGHTFHIYKFRSMREDAEAVDSPQLYSGEEDPRLTRVGRFLRAHHLDELPQLWNVLRGDMSLIGYRPERAYYIGQIMERNPRYRYLYQIRPGVTSYATLYNGYTDTLEKMLKRLDLDLYYLRNRSVWFDLKVLGLTFLSIVVGRKF